VSDDLAIDYLPDRNAPLGGTITFADGHYQFPLNLQVDKLERVLQGQADEYDDEVGASRMPTIRIRRDDAVYDVGYRPDLETGERRAAFVAKRDRYGDDMLDYTNLQDVVEQVGLAEYTDSHDTEPERCED
jgi:hypothetical protein